MKRLGKQGGLLRGARAGALAALLAAVGTAAVAEEPPAPVLGTALEAVLPAALIRDLERGGGRLSASGVDGAPPRLAPDWKGLGAEEPMTDGAALLVERLRLIEKPDGFGKGAWTDAEKAAVLNVLASISSLAGTRYYSPSRKERRTLYEASFIVGSPADKTPLPDPVFTPTGPLPPSFTLYARQRDLTFGENVYRYGYSVYGGAIVLTQTNCGTLRYGIIPIASKESVRVLAAVIDAGEQLLVYAASSAASLPPIPAVSRKAADSFAARADALLDWFAATLSARHGVLPYSTR
jgi:hypothetical protein